MTKINIHNSPTLFYGYDPKRLWENPMSKLEIFESVDMFYSDEEAQVKLEILLTAGLTLDEIAICALTKD